MSFVKKLLLLTSGIFFSSVLFLFQTTTVHAQSFPCEAPYILIPEQTSQGGNNVSVNLNVCVETPGNYLIEIVGPSGNTISENQYNMANRGNNDASLIPLSLPGSLSGNIVTFRLKSVDGQVLTTRNMNVVTPSQCQPPGAVITLSQETNYNASGCASFGPYTLEISYSEDGTNFTHYTSQNVPISQQTGVFSLTGQIPQVSTQTIWRFEFVHSDGTIIDQQRFTVTGQASGGTDEDSSSGDGAGSGGVGFEGGVGAEISRLNPLNIGNTGTIPNQADQLSTPAGILSRFLSFVAFPLAGLILFIMIVWGGFEILAQSATKKSIDAGRQRITAAIFGFILLFTAYWAVQIIQVVFGIRILY